MIPLNRTALFLDCNLVAEPRYNLGMSIDNWIALASSLVGMAAAIAAMLTVLEMRRQRRSLYKPEIALVTHNWELCVSGESFSAASWQLSRGEEETKEKYLKRDIPVQVFNVGSGAGKDLVIKFSYDIKGFIDALAIMKETRWTIKYNHPMLTLKEIATKYESFDMVANQEIHPRIAYLLPANTQPEGISINLPSGYGLLMKAYFLSLCRVDTETLKQYSLPRSEERRVGKECRS